MRIFSYIILLVVVILGLTFAMLNAEPVSLNYYAGTRTISLSLLLVLSIGIGVVIGLLLALKPLLRLKRKNYQLKNNLRHTEKEIIQ
jgi:putative membrane protein